MNSINFLGLKILRKGEFKNMMTKLNALEHHNAEALKYLDEIADSKSRVAPPLADGKYSEVISKLSSFQEAMAKLVENSEQTRWHDAGMARFNELLTHHYENQQELYDKIVSQLSKYVNANQAALFLLEDVNSNDSKIRMEACYAYDRKKYTQRVFDLGENLVGQSILERNTIFLTNVPQFYTHITSGLGEATPHCILITPLIDDHNCIGAIEMASFRKFTPAEIRFVESLSKSITSSIHNIKQNDVLKDLFQKSEAAQMSIREKEEEIRQQMEELKSTNEEMARKSIELERMKNELEKKNKEIESIREQEKELLESKLEAQKRSYEMIIDRLKEKLKNNIL